VEIARALEGIGASTDKRPSSARVELEAEAREN
jgi:hypothetical protein